jgi:hypothetical protein
MRRSVPRCVHLPGGYDIYVVRFKTSVANKEMGADVFAEWDVDTREIHLRSSRHGQELREDFIHEMEHAMVDWKDWFLGKSELV